MDKVHETLAALNVPEIEAWVELLEENRDLRYPLSLCSIAGIAARDGESYEKRSYLVEQINKVNTQLGYDVVKAATPFWVKGDDLEELIRHYYLVRNPQASMGQEYIHYANSKAFHAYVCFVTEDGRTLEFDDLPADVIEDLDTFANRRRAIADQLIAFLKEYLAQRPADAA